MQSVILWLNSRQNYSTGAKLYHAFGGDASLKKFFSNGEPSAYKKNRLVQVLSDLVDTQKNTSVIIEQKTDHLVERSSVEATTKKGWSQTMDEVEAALHAQWLPKFKEMMDLCSNLDTVARDGLVDPYKELKAGEMAFRILDLDDECDELYEQRDHYNKHGVLIAQKEYGELVVDPKKMPMALQNHHRYARDYRSKLKKEPDNLDYAQQLKKHEWFVQQYKKKLNIE
jgi:hypothetical protein